MEVLIPQSWNDVLSRDIDDSGSGGDIPRTDRVNSISLDNDDRVGLGRGAGPIDERSTSKDGELLRPTLGILENDQKSTAENKNGLAPEPLP